jgi:hypothetical protein
MSLKRQSEMLTTWTSSEPSNFSSTTPAIEEKLIIFPFIFQLLTLNFVVPKLDASKAETNIFKLF